MAFILILESVHKYISQIVVLPSSITFCNTTDLRGADLCNANLEKANLKEAKLGGANLIGAKLSGTIMPDGSVHE